jgi:hypothetical protein
MTHQNVIAAGMPPRKGIFAMKTLPQAAALSAIAILFAATSTSAQVYLSETATKTPRPTDEIKFESQSVSNAFIHIENGPLVVSPIKEDAWSSRWYVEPAGEGDFVRIKNKWTGCYLNVEKGPLVCDKDQKQGGWWSAQWRLVPDVDVKYSIINRWTECKLTNSGSGLRCMKNANKTADNLWRPINLTPQTAFVRKRPKPAAPPPAPANESPPQIDQGGEALFLTTDGAHPDRMTLQQGQWRSKLSDTFDEDIEVIYITGQYTEVIGYEGQNFTGRRVTLRCGLYELIGDPENEIRSIKVIKAVRPSAECLGDGIRGLDVIGYGSVEGAVEIHEWDR